MDTHCHAEYYERVRRFDGAAHIHIAVGDVFLGRDLHLQREAKRQERVGRLYRAVQIDVPGTSGYLFLSPDRYWRR